MMKKNIGYLPDFRNARENIIQILSFFDRESSLREFIDFFVDRYGRKSDNTIRLTLNTIINYGLLVETDDFMFQVSSLGAEWMKNPTSEELIRIIDDHVDFIGDLLKELEGKMLSAEKLIAIADQKYEVQLSGPDFSRRCQVLKDAGLIKMNRRKLYSLTSEGEKFIELEVPKQKCPEQNPDRNTVVPEQIQKKKVSCKEEKTKNSFENRSFKGLIRNIMGFLDMAEKRQHIYGGGLGVRELYGMLDQAYNYQYEAVPEDTDDALELLSAPGIEAVARREDGKYYALTSFEETEQRINFYKRILKKWEAC